MGREGLLFFRAWLRYAREQIEKLERKGVRALAWGRIAHFWNYLVEK